MEIIELAIMSKPKKKKKDGLVVCGFTTKPAKDSGRRFKSMDGGEWIEAGEEF